VTVTYIIYIKTYSFIKQDSKEVVLGVLFNCNTLKYISSKMKEDILKELIGLKTSETAIQALIFSMDCHTQNITSDQNNHLKNRNNV